MKYSKPALTFAEQVALIKSRGLQIPDESRAIRHLSNISYYRLSAYMLPFKKLDRDGNVTDIFEEGKTWDNVYNLYRFDRKLRLLIFDAIERIEIGLRTQIIYQLSHKYGSHWQNNERLFKDPLMFQEIQKHIEEQLTSKKKADFISHYLTKYDDPQTPPSWMSVELLYINHLSKICQNLNARNDVVNIATSFGVTSDKTFKSWLHTINYVRNICAHHARLWNIRFAIQPEKYKYLKPDKVWLSDVEVNTVQSSKMFYFLCIILFFMQTINPNSKFKKHLFDLFIKFPDVDVRYMGFPRNWEEHPLWKV